MSTSFFLIVRIFLFNQFFNWKFFCLVLKTVVNNYLCAFCSCHSINGHQMNQLSSSSSSDSTPCVLRSAEHPTAEIHTRSSPRTVSQLQLFDTRTTPFNRSRAYWLPARFTGQRETRRRRALAARGRRRAVHCRWRCSSGNSRRQQVETSQHADWCSLGNGWRSIPVACHLQCVSSA